MDNSINWPYFLSNPLSDLAIGTAAGLVSKSTFLGTVATATAWLTADLYNRNAQYWEDSAMMILKGQITGVKLTVTPNCGNSYPAVFRTYTRY